MRLNGGLAGAIGASWLALSALACDCGPPDSDAGRPDSGAHDAGPADAGPADAGPPDAGSPDSGSPDAGAPDAGPLDAGPPDAGDAGRPDLCGDRNIAPWERCDDGNRVSGDGCAGDCSGVEELFTCPGDGGPCTDLVRCSDTRVEGAELCDDGNLDGGDGCDPTCLLEPGWRCPAGLGCSASRCGDGFRRGSEDCDDGNTLFGDGCGGTCRIEPGYACPLGGGLCSNAMCGDLATHPTESCDDGNSDFDDGCTPICTAEPSCTNGACISRCGDRVFQPDAGEQCDDGDLRNGDGCDSTCRLEPGYACTPEQPPALTLPFVLRDFRATHPDFETYTGDDTEIVRPLLGPDGKPVYAPGDAGRSLTTTGKLWFDTWYHDVPDANVTVRQQLALRPIDAGVLEFGSGAFFPLDGLGFGNEGFPNNFHFTTETRFWFIHHGLEEMHFVGDDDVFIFVNSKLAVNLGGIHPQQTGDFVLDAPTAAAWGLEPGGLYEVAMFHAERHTVGSTFRLTLQNFDFRLSRCASQCGDAFTDRTEECDDGVNDGGYGRCGRTCRWDTWCGDGVVQAPFEQCDDGKNEQPYGDGGCSPSCQRPHRCGDGHIDSRFFEECDDGNAVSGDGCGLCRIER